MDVLDVELDFRASQSLALEGLRNEVSRLIQSSRKSAGFEVTEKVHAALSCSDGYVRAAVEIHKDYLIEECQLETLITVKGLDVLILGEHEFEYKTDKWHAPVSIVDGDLLFKQGEYPHYWAALDAWAELKKNEVVVS